MKNRIAALSVAVGLTTACFGSGALQQVSSGYVGCPSDEIEISNDEGGFNQRSWDATCRGHIYHCSGAGRGAVACTEDAASVKSSRTARAGQASD